MTSLNVKLENFEEECINSIESIFDAYFLLSKENTVLGYRIKDELLNIYFGKERLQGEDFLNLLRSYNQQKSIKELKQRILENEAQLFEFNINVNDREGYYNIFIFNLANDQKLINFLNTDDQKKIEFDLAEERNTLKNIIELNPYAIEIKDIEGRHVSANKAFIDMFKSVAPPEYSIFTDPHIKKRGLLDKILKLREGKVIRMGEHWYDPRDSAIEAGLNLKDVPSSLICHKAVAFPIFDRWGRIKNYIMMHEDITKRKIAEKRLEESEKMYRDLFNNTPYAIWLVNLQGKIVDCNETMDKFMSVFTHTDLIGKPFRDVLKMFSRKGDPRFENLTQVFKERFKILIKNGYLEPIEFEISRGDGKTFWITLESSFVTIGKEKLIQLFIKDITKRKLAEIELDGLRKDLEDRVRERTIKLENSEKKYREAYSRADCYKGLFTHDISNIFQTIGNSMELSQLLLEEDFNKNEMLEYYEIVNKQIKRGKNLIANVRNLSEIEESEMPLVSTEIFEKLNNAIQFVRVNFQDREIKINLKSDKNKIHVIANDLLLDVFENILINSARYNNNECIEIEISISRVEENDKVYIKIEFKDNGIGIDDNRKKLIFKKNNKKLLGSKGMGLGLSLVAKLLDLCDGKIWVEDRIKGDYTQGTNFVLLIPEAG
ncbi:MAG: PAS domain S-box protein [Candidatus Hermodarchaeota archaeon]